MNQLILMKMRDLHLVVFFNFIYQKNPSIGLKELLIWQTESWSNMFEFFNCTISWFKI